MMTEPRLRAALKMKHLFALFLFAFTACAADRVTATITITNAPSDADTITINAAARTWKATVTAPATEVLIGASAGASATNLFRQLASYRPSGPVALGFSSTNIITIKGRTGQAMAVSLSAAYGTVEYATNNVVEKEMVRTEDDQTINGIKTFTDEVNLQGGGLLDGVTLTNTVGIYAGSSSIIDIGGSLLVGGNAIVISNTAPYLFLRQTDASANEQNTIIQANGSNLSIVNLSDLGVSPTTVARFTRSGVTAAAFSLFTATNIITGDWSFTRANNTSLANGNNATIDFGNKVYVKIKAGPSAAFAICGIAGGADGRMLIIDNSIAQNMTIANDSGVEPTAANRIYTRTGSDVTTTGQGVVTLIYDTEDSRWVLVSVRD
jgi:hypothetical protein